MAPRADHRPTRRLGDSAADIESAIEGFARGPHGGLFEPLGITTVVHRRLVFALATQHRLPAVYPYCYFATEGGLMPNGPDMADQ